MQALLLDDALLKCVVTEVNCYFEDTDISQGNVATHLRCGGIFSDSIIINFLLILSVKKSLKIGEYVMKLSVRKNFDNFFDQPCTKMQDVRIKDKKEKDYPDELIRKNKFYTVISL